MAVEYNKPPKPVMYKGRLYRSSLEAKWAAFFDLLRWRYEYEPFTCDGWLPDFAIFGEKVVLVEVKPIIAIDNDVIKKMEYGAKEGHELLLLGLRPLPTPERNIVLGWLGERTDDEPGVTWHEAVMGKWSGAESAISNPQGLVGFCAKDYGSFRDRITGCYDGGCYGDDLLFPEAVEYLWNKACNEIQWRPINP